MTISKKLSIGGQREIDMTEGSIFRHLINFALPLLVGNLFQQLYNTVDTWVVGNFVSNEAFSAVGTVGSVTNMLIGFFSGLASGAGVVISQNYGAKKYDKVSDTVHTSMVMTVIVGIFSTIVGVLLVPSLVRLMATPPEVVPESETYLTIYFAGILGLMIYNMGAGILRAVGDSRRPFFFLVLSTVLNIILDLVFVLVFKRGVDGVAYATILSQAISAVLIIIELMRSDSCIRLSLRKLGMKKDILFQIIRIGFPAAVKLCLTAFSNVFVQSYINYFGADFMSGWTAYSKIDQLLFMPMQSIALAATTFVGQNIGKGHMDRAKEGVSKALLMSLACTVVFMIPIMIFAPGLTAFFNDKPEVVAYGTLVMRVNIPFFVFSCFNQVQAAALRGAGKSQAPMFIMLGSFVAFRQVYLYVMANFISNTVIPISLCYPAGWMVCSLINYIYYKKAGLEGGRIIDK